MSKEIKLFIVRGPEGCGRQEYIKQRFDGASVISISSLLKFNPIVNFGKVFWAHNTALSLFIEALSGKIDPKRNLHGPVDIVIDGSLLKCHSYSPFIELANAWLIKHEVIQVVPKTYPEFEACSHISGRTVDEIKKDVKFFQRHRGGVSVHVSKIHNLK
jgi:hypothetical protein